MVKLDFIYNPYIVKTDILINGARAPQNDRLNIPVGTRLQEWVEDFPSILKARFNDKITINFTGTKIDFDDLQYAFIGSDVDVKFVFEKEKENIDIVEENINKIYKDIQKGPIADLKTKEITEAFNKAQNSEFEVNVVATMSSGKSTLINALLGKKIMPAANEATTATIVRIKDDDKKKDFEAIAYDKNHNVIERIPNVTLKDMQRLNEDKKVYTIDLIGDIAFVSSEGMSLVLVDTPGPNNSRDKQHSELTFQMLENSEKSLVLFVMNGRQLGINDEKIFLDFICDNMKKGGKKTRDRYVFAVNQLDAFKPREEDDGIECITSALTNAKKSLNERGIKEANIFPVSAGAALEKRIDDEDEEILNGFRKKAKKFDVMHFNDYYQFSHLPKSVKYDIDKELKSSSEDDKLEIYTGIRNIEEAIKLYINKYARTTKICNLVQSFNSRLTELATLANLEKELRNNKDAKVKLNNDIQQVKTLIGDAKLTKNFTNIVDNADYSSEVINNIRTIINDSKNQYKSLMSGKSNKVEYNIAKTQTETIEKQFEQCAAQTTVRIKQAIQYSFNSIISNVISQYLNHLNKIGIRTGAIHLASYNGVRIQTPDFSNSFDENTSKHDESYFEQKEYQIRVDGTKSDNAWGVGTGGAVLGGIIGGPLGALAGAGIGAVAGWLFGKEEHYETHSRPVKIEKFVHYVDMNEVAMASSHDFDILMNDFEKDVLAFIKTEVNRIKNNIKNQINEIDNLMLHKLDELEKLQNQGKETASVIAKKEKNLQWLKEIQHRVNEIIEY
jgi:predicted GTPase/gas vesicle protein